MPAATTITDLPSDVLGQIFLRTPVQYLYAGRCVCKSWYHQITKSQSYRLPFSVGEPLEFIIPSTTIHTLHLLHLLPYSKASELSGIMSTEVDNPAFEAARALMNQYVVDLDNHLLRSSGPPANSFLEVDYHVANSCNGIVCFGVTLEYMYDYCYDYTSEHHYLSDCVVLINPITREYLTIPIPEMDGSEPSEINYAFGYSSTSDEYKILRVALSYDDHYNLICRTTMVYTLGGGTEEAAGGMWREIEDDFDFVEFEFCSPATCFNNALHWMGRRSDSFKIVSFDLDNERFAKFLPELPEPVYAESGKMRVLGGSLSISLQLKQQQKVEIWILKKSAADGVEASSSSSSSLSPSSSSSLSLSSSSWWWSKAFVIDVVPPFRALFPKQFMKNGELLLQADNVCVFYDPQHKSFRSAFSISTIEREKHFDSLIAHSPSLISLKDVMKNHHLVKVLVSKPPPRHRRLKNQRLKNQMTKHGSNCNYSKQVISIRSFVDKLNDNELINTDDMQPMDSHHKEANTHDPPAHTKFHGPPAHKKVHAPLFDFIRRMVSGVCSCGMETSAGAM